MQKHLRDLVYHTSGLPDIHNELPEFNDPLLLRGKVTAEDLIQKIKSFGSLHFSPGSQFRYSNSNYILLAYVIEKVSNKSLDVFLHENIFSPYGMKSSGLYKEHSKLPDHAEGYYLRNGIVTYMPDFNFKNFWGSGNAYSTVHDLYRYMTRMYNELPYYYNEQLLQHTGYYLGYRTLIKMVPSIGFCVIILSNNGDSNPSHFLTQAQDYILPLLRQINLSPPSSAFQGEYTGKHLGEDIKISITCEKNTLLVNGNKTIQIDSKVFLLPENDFATITINTEDSVHHIRMNDNGYVIRFVKNKT